MHANPSSPPHDGRVALVTGAGSGIGRAAAETLARDGALVLALDINHAAAQGTVDLIARAGGRAVAVAADLADIAAMRAHVAQWQNDYGHVDILINNAAVGGGGNFADVSEETFDRLYAVNVKGTFFTTQAIVPLMKTRRFGRIVNVSSLIAVRGTVGNPHYAGAKAALFGFTRSWALELAPYGITVNTLVPALTITPMTTTAMSHGELDARVSAVPMGRLAMPGDLTGIIRFLCSSEAAFVTGQAISANGGEYTGPM